MHRMARCAIQWTAILGTLIGCAAPPRQSPPPATPAPPAASGTRWLAAEWHDLPGLAEDTLLQAWPAWRAGCTRPLPAWSTICARVLLEPPADEAAARQWLRTHLRPWRLEAADGRREGLATGYFEPELAAARRPDARFRAPVHALPTGLAERRPFFTRRQLESEPTAMATLRGLEIAWLEDPLDVLMLQVQGSGRLRMAGPDGRPQLVRLAFAGHNGQPFRAVGRWLVEQGEVRPDATSWPALRAWALQNPQRADELRWSNPRVVFFREEPLPDPQVGPRGALGVPLTPGRSIAVDAQSLPLGTPLWLDTLEPASTSPLRRLVLAQDRGAAITGALRVDVFFGWGAQAEAAASRMRQPLRLWALWPRDAEPPR